MEWPPLVHFWPHPFGWSFHQAPAHQTEQNLGEAVKPSPGRMGNLALHTLVKQKHTQSESISACHASNLNHRDAQTIECLFQLKRGWWQTARIPLFSVFSPSRMMRLSSAYVQVWGLAFKRKGMFPHLFWLLFPLARMWCHGEPLGVVWIRATPQESAPAEKRTESLTACTAEWPGQLGQEKNNFQSCWNEMNLCHTQLNFHLN